jgi:hypothetical protein
MKNKKRSVANALNQNEVTKVDGKAGQFTPGPWEYHNFVEHPQRLSNQIWHMSNEPGKSRLIAFVVHHPGQDPKEDAFRQQEADARLIAAAPELLEALKIANEWLEILAKDNPHMNVDTRFKWFQKVFAKAEGK